MKTISRSLVASLFGAAIGAACMLTAIHITNRQALVIEGIEKLHLGTSKVQEKVDVAELRSSVQTLNHQLMVIDEKIGFLHSRINDFYIFSGIVITLLLAINIGVFIRTDDEVKKHMEENFESYQNKIIAIKAECDKLLEQVKSNANTTNDITTKLRSNTPNPEA